MNIQLEVFRAIKGSKDYILVGEQRYMLYLADVLDRIYERDKRHLVIRGLSILMRNQTQIRLKQETMLLMVGDLVKYRCTVGTKAYELQQFFKERVLNHVGETNA